MRPEEDRARMREEIAFTAFANRKRRKEETTVPVREASLPHPPLPLLRPEYSTWPGVIGNDDTEPDFYIFYEQGRLIDAIGCVERL